MSIQYCKHSWMDIIVLSKSCVLGSNAQRSMEFKSSSQEKHKEYQVIASLQVCKGPDYILGHAQMMVDELGNKIVATLGRK